MWDLAQGKHRAQHRTPGEHSMMGEAGHDQAKSWLSKHERKRLREVNRIQYDHQLRSETTLSLTSIYTQIT